MNIKNISLLSLLIFTGVANTMSTPQKLDDAKRGLRDCLQSNIGHIFGCDSQEKMFEAAREEFLAIHREKQAEGIKAARQYCNESKTSIPFTFAKKYYDNKAWKKHRSALLEAWGSGWIVEAFAGRSSYSYLYGDKSTTELCDEVLKDVMKKYPPCQSSYIEDMIGKGFIQSADQAEIDAAKKNIENTINIQKTIIRPTQ